MKFFAAISMLSVLVFFTPYRVQAATTYATWNPDDNFVTLSGGNLVATVNGAWNGVRANIFKTTGKWYWEYTVSGCSPDNGDIQVGIGDTDDISSTGSVVSLNGVTVYGNSGQWCYNSTCVDVQASRQFVNGAVIGIGLDMNTPTLHFYENGTEMLSSPLAQVTGTSMTAEVVLGGTAGCAITANFGASAFAHSVPTGFNAGLYSGSSFELWLLSLF